MRIAKIAIELIFVIAFISSGFCWDDWEKAMELFKAGNYDKALEEFKEIVKYNPKLAEGYFMLGLCNYHLGKNKEAKENFQKALIFSPNHSSSLYYIGKLEYEEAQYKEAIKYLSLALANVDDPKKKLVMLKLRGICYLKIKEYQYSVADLSEVIKVDKDDASSYYAISSAYYNIGDMESAEKMIKIAINLEPSNKDYSILMLNILLESRKFKEAVKYVENSMIKNDNDQEVIELIADAYLGDRNYGTAILYYNRLTQLTDKVLYNKAQAYVGLGEYKEAEKILTSLAKKDNKNEKILNLLAYIYEKTDQLEQAMKLYDEIYKITKKSKYKESIERVQEKIKKQELEKSGG